MRKPDRFSALLFTGALAVACAESDPAGPDDAASAPGPTGGVGEEISRVLRIAEPLGRIGQLADLLTEQGPDALPAVQEAIEPPSPHFELAERIVLASWWAGFDAPGAYAWAGESRDSKQVMRAVLQVWGGIDPQAALQEVKKLPEDEQLPMASAVIVGWHASGKPGVDAHLVALGVGEPQQHAATAIARYVTLERGPRGAIDWVTEMPAGPFRDLMHQVVVGVAGMYDPALAAEWVAPQIDDGDRSSGLARRLAVRWVRSDPEAAMEWLSTLPDGGTREDGVEEAFRDWIMLAREDAIAWMEGQLESGPPEVWLEPALVIYARGPLTNRDPVAAMELAGSLSDETRRNTALTYVARRWLSRDYETADAYIKQANLPEGVEKRAYMLGRRARQQLEQKRAAQAAEAEAGAKAAAAE